MKRHLLLGLIVLGTSVATAQRVPMVSATKAPANITAWGTPIDPDHDCRFFVAGDDLLITVPGSHGPHDLAAEIHTINAPRVLQPVRGDFVIQVRIDGRLSPGDESTLEGRTGYNGAGLVLMADPRNVVCLARAVLHRSGEDPQPYANFEMRSQGKLDRIGYANEHPLPRKGAVFLQLERRGEKLFGAVSSDGRTWEVLPPKEIPTNWPKNLQVGVVAISTSKKEFTPRFSRLKISK